MTASIEVRDLAKVFTLATKEGRPVGLMEALRRGEPSKATREVRALNRVSFSVAEGERLGIIGRNGAGKTTLLSILAGLSEPSAGTVEIEGDIHAMLTIGTVLREDLTGLENIRLDAAMHGRAPDGIDALTDDIVAFSELGEFITRPVRTYSSGMKARLAFAMSAFIDPDILILDETLAVGDVFFSQKAARCMKAIAARGRIVVLVSQATSAIREMCTRCLWLDQGEVRMDGPPDQVTAAYEAAVRDADEAALRRKFGADPDVQPRPEIGRLSSFQLLQRDKPRQASTIAMTPLTVRIEGELSTLALMVDLELSLTRVDGRRIWRQRLADTGQDLGDLPSFVVDIAFDPFILGEGLYRLDVRLADQTGLVDALARVFEVVDEQGQFGGCPMLLHTAMIRTTQCMETAS